MPYVIDGRKFRDTPKGKFDCILMQPMRGTPDKGTKLPGVSETVDYIANNTPLKKIYPKSTSDMGYRDMLIRFEKLTGQTPALLNLWRKAFTKSKRELDFHVAEQKRGIDLQLKKLKAKG
jgi:hypothetical protein